MFGSHCNWLQAEILPTISLWVHSDLFLKENREGKSSECEEL